ncbi:MAG: glycosyltransferase family 2 protein [Acidimicrobiia bacterium]
MTVLSGQGTEAGSDVPDVARADPEVELRIPENDVADPVLSIVIPALNEELTIEQVLAWCREGIANAGVTAEVLIVDSSDDRTAERALAAGARVLSTPRRGLGHAYKDALPFVRGRYMILGDADCTYDFRQLRLFLDRFEEGYEFIMGSRFKGGIEPGSMPFLHRRLGTPITTWMLNRVYSSSFSDIHCGMRGITTDAFRRMKLRSDSWEYASEMVLKSVRMKLRTTEVPVQFLKEPEGRVSHHKREGWTSPWKAAWINLRAMFIYGADFFTFGPGIVMAVLGALLIVPLTFGPISIGPVTFSLYWMLIGLTLCVLGTQSFFLGCLARVLYDRTGTEQRRWLAVFPYTRAVLAAMITFGLGCLLIVPLAVEYLSNDLALTSIGWRNHAAITGVTLLVVSFMTFAFTLILHALIDRLQELRGFDLVAPPSQ